MKYDEFLRFDASQSSIWHSTTNGNATISLFLSLSYIEAKMKIQLREEITVEKAKYELKRIKRKQQRWEK